MPFPLLPFAIKGAIIVIKAASTKAAVAKGAAVTVKTIGVANSVAACVVIGGIAWTAANVERARKAYSLATNGNLQGAAGELLALGASVHSASTDTLSTDLNDWISDGHPLDRRVLSLAKRCYDAAEDAS